MNDIFAIGDSITYGAWDGEAQGWVSRLRKKVEEREKSLVYNLGIPGETTDGLLKRAKLELAWRLGEGKRATVILAYGSNDVAYLVADQQHRVPLEQFRRNYEQAIEAIKPCTAELFLLTAPPVNEAIHDTLRPHKQRSNRDVERYNQVVQDVAQANQATLVDVYSAFQIAGFEQLLSEDGLHPNAAGNQLIAESFQKVLGL